MGVLTIILSIILILYLLYLFVRNKYNYWRKRNVPYLEPTLLLGNYGEWILQRECVGIAAQKICKNFQNEPYIGAYEGTKPVLILLDPEMIKLVTTKEFAHFSSRELSEYVHKETFGQSIIATYGEDWKLTKSNLAPMFTISKLKSMFPLIQDCAYGFGKYLGREIEGKPVEAKKLAASYTMAAVGSCAFGADFRNFGEDNSFKTITDMIFDTKWVRGILLCTRHVWPGLFYGLGFELMPKDMIILMRKFLTDVFETRSYKPSGRKDFIDLLLNLKETAQKRHEHISLEYMIAQAISIFVAGFETSAATLGFLLYEIAKNEEIQAKMHKEIDVYLRKTNGEITYDCLTELPYLEACIDETMRCYPVIGVLTREVIKNYTLPTGLVLNRGLRIHIPVYYLHHNPKYFPNPEEFYPERFYGDTKQKIVPYSYLPFGEGPRTCIGKRFAKLSALPALVTMLRDHTVQLAEGMPSKLQFEPNTIVAQCKGGIYVKFLPRN